MNGTGPLTQGEKDLLVRSVADAVMQDVLRREDMVEILRICRDACDRRIREVQAGMEKTLKN